jgi:hypothetical protein
MQGCSVSKKRGAKQSSPFLRLPTQSSRLECVAPVQKDVDPISSRSYPPAPTEDRLLGTSRPGGQILSLVPHKVRAHTHLGRDEIPQIPLPQQHRIAVVLTVVLGHPTLRSVLVTPQLIALKVRAKQYQPNDVWRTRQPSDEVGPSAPNGVAVRAQRISWKLVLFGAM